MKGGFIMKIFKKILCCTFALAFSGLILYLDILSQFPSEITMYQNEEHTPSLGAMVTIGDFPENISASSTSEKVTPLKTGQYNVTLKIADKIPFKKVKLNVTAPKTLCASGELIGLRLHNRGLIVTEVSPIISGEKELSPAKDAGILSGDVII